MPTSSLLIRKNDRIVFLGDSITDAQMYTNYVETYLTLRYPELNLRFFNAGWGGDTTLTVARRLERDVLALKPTLVTISLGMNDGKYTAPTDQILADYSNGLDEIVRSLKQQRIRILLLTPGAVDEEKSSLLLAGEYNAKGLRRLADFALRYARKQKIPAYDMLKLMLRVQSAAKAADPTFCMSPDSVHPDEAGHLVMAYGLLEALGVPSRKVLTTIAAKTGRATSAPALKATEIAHVGDRLSFSIASTTKLYRVPGGAVKVLPFLPFQQKFNSIYLAIRGLAPGRYIFRDGPNRSHVVQADALAAGINLADLHGSTDLDASGRIADEISSKNSIYFGIWRNQALGSTHGDLYDRPIHRSGIALGERLDALVNQRVRKMSTSKKSFEVFPAPGRGEIISDGDFLTQWETTDPISADFAADGLGGEALASSLDHPAPPSIAWTPRQFDPTSLGNCLGTIYPNCNHCFAYARIRLFSPGEQSATLLLGSDDGFAAWLNGVSIGENLHVQRGVSPDQDRFPVTLQAGPNLLLVKITQVVYGWGFCVRFQGLSQPIIADWPAPPAA
jgi:lysophospholipase L1-like esterase